MQNIDGEIVFVDDASEDGTHGAMRRIADEYGTAIIIKNMIRTKDCLKHGKQGLNMLRASMCVL